MKRIQCQKRQRRGTVAPLIALLLIPLLGMVAFAVDIGWVVIAKSDLQKAADSAALAGAGPLLDGYMQYEYGVVAGMPAALLTQLGIPSVSQAMTLGTIRDAGQKNASQKAKTYASFNAAGTVSSLTLMDRDIEFGYTYKDGSYETPTPSGKYPNTIKVLLRLDNTDGNPNGPLQLFFGKVFGVRTENVTAVAAATIYTSSINNFSSSGPNGSLLPIAVDQTQWTDFYQKGINSWAADPNAPAGQAWLQVYPGGQNPYGGSSMDGLLSLMGSKAASQQYYSGTTGWIEAGPTAADIKGLRSSGDLPTDPSNPPAWASGPGMKSSLLPDFQSLITSPPTTHLLPLFDPNSPNTTPGGNGTYGITYFVPVNVVYAQGQGKANMDVAIVPATPYIPLTDPTTASNIAQNQVPAGESTVPPQYQVAVAPKLSL